MVPYVSVLLEVIFFCLYVFKSKSTNLTFYFSRKLTFLSLKYIKGSMIWVFSPQANLDPEACIVKKGSQDFKTEFSDWGN